MYGAVTLPYAAGWAGTPGTIKVTACRDEGSTDTPSYHCSGTFTSDDGSITDSHATVSAGSREDGHTIDVRRSGTGGYHVLGFVPVAESVAAILMGGVPLLVTLLTRRKRPGTLKKA
ncbi:hypothetical protein ABZ858_29680 [Streptomyces sp. NPDC047017]|uniref:hypothetical protein n=1 Tax=Streptomyces sp. NPDC047017 TaxID=3155024 RepID=UPI0033D34CB4